METFATLTRRSRHSTECSKPVTWYTHEFGECEDGYHWREVVEVAVANVHATKQTERCMMKIPYSFATHVVLSVPVAVSGEFNEAGEFHVNEVTQRLAFDKDVTNWLSPQDMEELADQAFGHYNEAIAEFEREMKAEGKFRRSAEDVS
jgi:hypothetical protein